MLFFYAHDEECSKVTSEWSANHSYECDKRLLPSIVGSLLGTLVLC
jgi:hypothetical protein